METEYNKHLDNTVEAYGLDPKHYTNKVSVRDVRVGDKIVVFDLSSYTNPPHTPQIGVITTIYDYPYIKVKFPDEKDYYKEWEAYEGQFGFIYYPEHLLNLHDEV